MPFCWVALDLLICHLEIVTVISFHVPELLKLNRVVRGIL